MIREKSRDMVDIELAEPGSPAFVASTDLLQDGAILRRFGSLTFKVLVEKESRVSQLEARLKRLLDGRSEPRVSAINDADEIPTVADLMEMIDIALQDYRECAVSTSADIAYKAIYRRGP